MIGSNAAVSPTVAEELVVALRGHLGTEGLAYASVPKRLGGGFFTENYAFRLAGAPPDWDGPLVVRLFPNSAPPELASHEAAVQSAHGPGLPCRAGALVRR